MSKQTIEQELMTECSYTWDRACELVNQHIDAVSKWKQGGWNNREIADKLVAITHLLGLDRGQGVDGGEKNVTAKKDAPPEL